MSDDEKTDAEKHSFDWLVGRTTMSDTPRTDAFEELGFHEQPINWWDFARQLERELAAKDKEIADIRAERLRNETFWLGFLQDELAAQQEFTNEKKNTTQTNL